MLDFTSALYLGMRHPSAALDSWDALTQGRPASCAEPCGSVQLAARLAARLGCQRATLLPSSLHLFWDLFTILAREPVVILANAACYPIARWGIERAAALGVPVAWFPQRQVARLERLALQWAAQGRRPVIVTDGYAPACAAVAPLPAYAGLAQRLHGYLVIDDTQALGILGTPDAGTPYGRGGGGSLCWHALQAPHILYGASLAKAFGAPLAVLAGSDAMVRRFEEDSQTRVHTSPVSSAVIAAGERALDLNKASGDVLRAHLHRLVRHLRERLAQQGLTPSGGAFPVQTVALPPGLDALTLHTRLQDAGLNLVLQGAPDHAALTWLVTARHGADDIDRAAARLHDGLKGALVRPRWRQRRDHARSLSV